jgi:hypothetical protein
LFYELGKFYTQILTNSVKSSPKRYFCALEKTKFEHVKITNLS